METRRNSTATRASARRRRASMPGWALGALGALFLLATAFSAYLVYTTVRDVVAAWDAPAGGGQPAVINPNPTAGANTAFATATAGQTTISFLPWNGTDRVTVLVMGIDQRTADTDTAYRTDSMMLLTLDPVGLTAGMLSIPRDLYVEIPGFPDRDKITTANFKGDAYHLPGGGAQLAIDTVELNLGIRVDYYVRINFTAFETFIDQIGGIDVNNPETIDDPLYPDCCYGFDPFYLPAGPQHLDGRTALKYARTRHSIGDDFGRAQRQQQVVLAVRDKLSSANSLPTLITQAPAILGTISGSYDTNFSLDQMASLALLAKDIPRDRITSAVINQDYIADIYTTADNQQVLILNIEKFRELRDTMFYTPEPPQLSVPNAADLIAGEAATVEVLNGSSTAGIAASAADYLRAKGVNVVNVGNADRSDYGATVIYDFKAKPYTTRWLADTFHVSSSSILASNNPDSPVDIRIVIGQDFVLPSN